MFKIGDTVKVRVCNFNGLVIFKRTIDDINEYEVTYPDKDGLPVNRYFTEIELEDAQNNKLGFGG